MKRIVLILVIQIVAFVAFGQTHDAPSNSGNGGYISTGNYAGTGNAAYFPSGIYTNGSYSWFYGNIAFGFGSLYDRDNKWSINPAGNSWFKGGNVGIGTSTPGALLTIDKNMTGSPTSYMLRLMNSAGTNTPTADFQLENEVVHILGLHGRSGVGNADKLIQVWNLNTGNVGIGTTTPGAKLSFGNYYISSSAPSSSEQTSHIRLYESGSAYYGLGVSDGALNIAANQSGGTLRFYTNSTEKVRIDGNGNVGIGTTNPQYILDVVGSQRWHFPTGFNLDVEDWKLTDKRGPTLSAFNDAGTEHVPLSFAASLFFFHSGSVGIDTYNTQGYKLAVNGSILCEGVKVIADVPNSDYVFNNDYKLLNLPLLERFVKENNHLPEVPSAEEFKKNGYSVGEMDNLLLKKVEELTLYIIELNKKIEVLEKEVKQKTN
ncbi:MAG: hypothetical protein HXX16_01195 [Bacteroidales bacterium]|nr:hypothetical protein [Bacteroidales bacterium]